MWLVNKSRAILWERAHEEIARSIARLKASDPSQLQSLMGSETRNLREGRFTATISAWSESHPEKLAVLVEAREKRYGGLWDFVFADGFFVHADGHVEPMPQADIWDHGY